MTLFSWFCCGSDNEDEEKSLTHNSSSATKGCMASRNPSTAEAGSSQYQAWQRSPEKNKAKQQLQAQAQSGIDSESSTPYSTPTKGKNNFSNWAATPERKKGDNQGESSVTTGQLHLNLHA